MHQYILVLGAALAAHTAVADEFKYPLDEHQLPEGMYSARCELLHRGEQKPCIFEIALECEQGGFRLGVGGWVSWKGEPQIHHYRISWADDLVPPEQQKLLQVVPDWEQLIENASTLCAAVSS